MFYCRNRGFALISLYEVAFQLMRSHFGCGVAFGCGLAPGNQLRGVAGLGLCMGAVEIYGAR